MPTYTPSANNAAHHAYAGRDIEDPIAYTSYNQKTLQAKYNPQEWSNEILALWKAATALPQYRQTFTCVSGLAVGDPVYISANNTATLADATTSAKAKVFGFCVYKPTTTTCYIGHYYYKSGLSGLTANGIVYLTDAGGFSASAGTVTKSVGVALSTTEALLHSDSLSAVGSSVSLTGDVTGSGVGSIATTIANDAVTTAKITNDAVTYAKMQNVSAADRLLGRDTAGAGDCEELTVGGGIEFTGSGGIQTSALTGDVTKSAGGTATTIANDAVTTGKILNDAVTTAKIANDQVTYAKLQNVSATDRLLGRDTAGAGDCEELTVGGGIEFTGTGGIQTSAFTGDVTKSAGGTATTIANDAVTTAKIANDQVTYAKLQNVSATDRLLGRDTAGAGDCEELTVGGGIEFTGTGGIQTGALGGDIVKAAGSTTTQAGSILITSKSALTYVDSGDELVLNDSSATELKRITPNALFAYVKLVDLKAVNTSGGTFTSGAWRTRTLNTESSDASGLCVLSSNQFTLTAGTYLCLASAPAYIVDRHKTRIRNTTAGTDLIIGTSEDASSLYNVQNRSYCVGQFTVAASQALELQHWCQTTAATYGFGIESNFDSKDEIYAMVELWKVA